MKINNKNIGDDNPVFFIAEAGVNHNGSLEVAKKLIDMAKDAGADAVKFQTFRADNIITVKAPKSNYHIDTTGNDKIQSWYELLKSQELTKEMHITLIDYCKKSEIIFLSTPYDYESVDLLLSLYVPAIKIASTDTNNIPLIEYISQKGIPVILSTAMASMEEVENAVSSIKQNGNPDYAVLQCSGNYPANIYDSNLRVIETYKSHFNCIVGYSDHTTELINPIAATALGAKIYEKHITLDKNMPGPDHRMSLNKDELINTIKAIRNTELALGSSKKLVLESEIENRLKLRKSIVSKEKISKDDILTKEMVGIKRPGHGISPEMINTIIGKKLKIDLGADEVITSDMLYD